MKRSCKKQVKDKCMKVELSKNDTFVDPSGLFGLIRLPLI